MDRKIYFAASPRGEKEAEFFAKLIKHLKKYGTVLTENTWADPKTHRDLYLLISSTHIITEITRPSIEIGYGLGRIADRNLWDTYDRKHILCLYHVGQGKEMPEGLTKLGGLVTRSYKNQREAKREIDGFFKLFNSS